MHCQKNCGWASITIKWNVDDMKIPYHDPSKIDIVAHPLARIYGKIKIKQGRKHDYLGMCLDCSERGKLKVSIKEYIDKIIEGSPEIIDKTAMTPAADYLFKIVDEEEKKLYEERSIAFNFSVGG